MTELNSFSPLFDCVGCFIRFIIIRFGQETRAFT